jgi:hypothetical protein
MDVAARHPLRITGTALPPNVLLMAKLVTLSWLLKGYVQGFPSVFLPLWRGMEVLPAEPFRIALQVVFLVGAACLFTNRVVRTACLAMGLACILAVLACKPYYRNANLYCGCLLFLAGLQDGTRYLWMLRLQVVLMYLGAGLNKLFDPDWRLGQYFDFLFRTPTVTRLLGWFGLASVPARWWAVGLCWSTITVELSLATMFLIRPLYLLGVWLAILFHSASMVVFKTDFGMFILGLAASYVVFVDWPARIDVSYDARRPSHARLRRFITLLDADGSTRWTERPGALSADDGRWRYEGFAAAKRLLLHLPVLYVVMVVLMCVVKQMAKPALLAFAVLFFSPLTDGRWPAWRRSVSTPAAPA